MNLPTVTSDYADQFAIGVRWYPQIPIEVSEKATILNARLQAGGISLETYLSELGCDDVDEEMGRIWTDKERQAEIDAMAQVKIAEIKARQASEQAEMQLEQRKEQVDQQKARMPQQTPSGDGR